MTQSPPRDDDRPTACVRTSAVQWVAAIGLAAFGVGAFAFGLHAVADRAWLSAALMLGFGVCALYCGLVEAARVGTYTIGPDAIRFSGLVGDHEIEWREVSVVLLDSRPRWVDVSCRLALAQTLVLLGTDERLVLPGPRAWKEPHRDEAIAVLRQAVSDCGAEVRFAAFANLRRSRGTRVQGK